MVAYRFLTGHEAPFGDRNSAPYTIIKNKWMHWCADPFPFERGGKHYIFMEEVNLWGNKGHIGYCCLEEGAYVYKCLEEPFHLSYPNVFAWGEDVYMIPETHNAKQLRLYRAVRFPEQWELDSVLLEGVDLADASFFFGNEHGTLYIEAQETQGGECSNRFFMLEMRSKKITEILPEREAYLNKRPAGNFFLADDGCVYHALQECSREYGEHMHICKVDAFDEKGLEEQACGVIKANQYKFLNAANDFERTHTLNRSDDVEVIDVYKTGTSFFYFIARCYKTFRRIAEMVNNRHY